MAAQSARHKRQWRGHHTRYTADSRILARHAGARATTLGMHEEGRDVCCINVIIVTELPVIKFVEGNLGPPPRIGEFRVRKNRRDAGVGGGGMGEGGEGALHASALAGRSSVATEAHV